MEPEWKYENKLYVHEEEKNASKLSVKNGGLTSLTIHVTTINWWRKDLWKMAFYLHLLA